MPVTHGKSQPEPEPAPGAVPAGDFQPVANQGQVTIDESETVPNEVVQEVSDNASKSNEEIASEVVAGRWGRGNERKRRLQAAGYDIALINEEVSKIFNR